MSKGSQFRKLILNRDRSEGLICYSLKEEEKFQCYLNVTASSSYFTRGNYHSVQVVCLFIKGVFMMNVCGM
jgi:hypothetical protein